MPEFWFEPATGEIWTSKVGTNMPRVLDQPVRIRSQLMSPDGYKTVSTRRDGMSWPIRVHRIIAECVTGRPIMAGWVIDHIDGNRTNNSPDNLRIVRPVENNRNMTKTPSHNRSSGLIGVSFYARTRRWKAYISVNNRHRHIGYFATREEAREAYLDVKKECHGIPKPNLDSEALVLS
jgi:hypothetical protein